MATTSAWAVGSLVELTTLVPCPTTRPALTTKAANGPPWPWRTFSIASWMACRMKELPMLNRALLSDGHQRDHVERALRHYDVPVPGGHHVAHDAAAGGDGPGLELFGLRIEAHQSVRLHRRFVVPDDSIEERDSIRLRHRPARRRPFLHRAGLGVEPPQVAARVVGVINEIVVGDGNAARPRIGVRQRPFLDRHGI